MGWNLQAILDAMAQLQAAPQAAPAPPEPAQHKWEWAPDHSSAIDRTAHPDAQWHDLTIGGEEGGSTAAGWFEGGGWGDEGYSQPHRIDDRSNDAGNTDGSIARTYQELKAAGLWNLTDPNSDTWKYLNAKGTYASDAAYGRTADVKNDPNALYRAINEAGVPMGAGKDPAQYAAGVQEMLAGLNPEFVSQFSNAGAQAMKGYWGSLDSDSITFHSVMNDMGDAARGYREMILTNPALMAAAIAITGGAAAGAMGGSAGAGAAEGGALAGGTAGASAGSGIGATVGAGLNSIASPLVDLGLSQGTANAAVIGGGLSAGKTALAGGNFGDVLKGGALGATGAAVTGGAFGTEAGMPVGPDGMPMGGSLTAGGLESPFLSGLDSSAIAGTDFSGGPSGVWGGGLDGVSASAGDMSFLDGIGDPLGGFTTNPSLDDLGGITGDFGATGALGGSGMDDLSFLDGMGDPLGDFTTDPSLGDLDLGGGGFGLDGDMSWLDGIGDPLGDFTTNPSLEDLGGDTSAWSQSTFGKYGSKAVELAKKFLGGSGGAEALKQLAKLGVPAALIGGLFEKNQSPLVGPMKQAAEAAIGKANQFSALQGPGITPSQQKAITLANQDPAWKSYFDKAGALVDSGTSALDPNAINSYVNPYLQGALDPAIRDIQRASEMRRQALRAQVAKSGNDFRTPGTNRFNVEDNLLDETTLQEIGDLSGKMHADAFNYATGLAKSDKDRALTGANTVGTLGKGAGALQTNDFENLTKAGALERQPYEDTRANLGDATKLYTGVVHGTAPALGPTTPDSLLTKGAGALGALKTAKDLELY